MITVALVGCGKSKRLGTHPARHLYTGPLFRASLAHAERIAERVFIVSAFYGLVELDQKIESYDRTVAGMAKTLREAWGDRVAAALCDELRQHGDEVEVTILAGAAYAEPIRRGLRWHNRRPKWNVLDPLRGLGQGARLAWFKSHRNDRR